MISNFSNSMDTALGTSTAINPETLVPPNGLGFRGLGFRGLGV